MPHLPYPPSPRNELVEELHCVKVSDPYRWLEDIDSPETRLWIDAQNHLSSEFLRNLPCRDAIHQRLTELWSYEKFGLPVQRGGRVFFTRNDGLQNQPVLYWMKNPQAEPVLLLDPNSLSADGTTALSVIAPSDDGKLLLYGLSSAGSDWQEWHIREVETGKDIPDLLRWIKFSSPAWTPDGQGFYYSHYDEPVEGLAYKGANFNQKLSYHRLGEAQTADQLIYRRPEQPKWGFHPQVSEEGEYLVVSIWAGTQEENAVLYRDLRQPDSPFVELLSDFDAVYEFLGNDGSIFYFRTDLDAPLYRVIAIDLQNPARQNWHTVLPESADALQSASLAGGKVVGLYLHDAHSLVRIFNKDGTPSGQVDLPGMGTIVGFEGRQKDHQAYYLYSSFTRPATVYCYEFEAGQSRIFRRPEIDLNPDDFVTEQVFFPSKDGTRVPMFVSYRNGLSLNGDLPTLLYGYGGFNLSRTPEFMLENIVWMEMGGVFVQVNLRGGGEYGKLWHEAGMKANKQNVFDDFIAAAEWLSANGYTNPKRIAIYGRSNGGLLTGACLTQRPDLFAAALVVVGVLDMLRFHQFTIGWGWVSDYGSPDDPAEFPALLAYSPYHNIKPGANYPATLITTGDHDDRVFPAHSYKFAAALQAAQGGEAPILIRIDTNAGHGLGKPMAKLLEETADLRSFAAWATGLVS